ncbi:MAG: PAS domain-containing protein [Pseudomonadota bacterium]
MPQRLTRLLNGASLPITVADANARDQPLIFANPPFAALTGYSVSETMGRNCRFLQRDLPNEAARAQIREAIAARKDLQVRLYNIRRDGTEFENLLFLYFAKGLTDAGLILGAQFELSPISKVEAPAYARYLTDNLQRAFADSIDLRRETKHILADQVAAQVDRMLRLDLPFAFTDEARTALPDD